MIVKHRLESWIRPEGWQLCGISALGALTLFAICTNKEVSSSAYFVKFDQLYSLTAMCIFFSENSKKLNSYRLMILRHFN